MKIALYIYIFILPFSLIGQGITLDEARKLYSESMNNKSVCEAAYKKFSQVNISNNILLRGYKGAVSVAMSKHLKIAKEKIAYFNEGKSLIEAAILEDNKNVELKFIRFTIQSNCPPALKYNKNMTEDSKYIIENLTSVKNIEIRSRIKEYLLQSESLSKTEKEKLNAL